MSNIYIQEPPTSGKVVMKTSVGDIEVELWTKEAPKACRNFIQLCMEGYYENTIFHRVVKGFIVQGGDPTGSGHGGQSIYENPFKDEFHTRLRFCRRGLLAMANAGKDDNGSQFFFTLGATPELQNKHTIFGKVTGETVYNMLKLEEALVDDKERPLYPQKILKTDVITNPFRDIEPRSSEKSATNEKIKDERVKKQGVKNFKLLSFGEEAEEDEEETAVVNKRYSGKSKSAHDNLADPKLSSVLAIEQTDRPEKRKHVDDSSSEDEEEGDHRELVTSVTSVKNDSGELRESVKSKLKGNKSKLKTNCVASEKTMVQPTPEVDEEQEEEYYLGKDRKDERKKQAEAIRKEIREFKRDVQNEKNAKVAVAKEQIEAVEKQEAKGELVKAYMETQVKYKEATSKVPKKGTSRENFALDFMKKFQKKLQNAKEQARCGESEMDGRDEGKTVDSSTELGNKVDGDGDPDADIGDAWMTRPLHCEESGSVLAKDASTKDDDWFEIYDPRNPLNKRRRGEKQTTRTRNK